MFFLFGVDSVQSVNQDLLNCVTKNYGKPLYWGRYLSSVSGHSEGLTRNEILLLHENGIRVLPIFNNFSSSAGLQNGKTAGRNAVFKAKMLRIPTGKILFANVIGSFDIDHLWIEGWFEGVRQNGYRVGYYHDPFKGSFNEEYCKAANRANKLSEQSVLWSAEPEVGISKKEAVPRFNPKTVQCKSHTWGWQYGRNANDCPIDTNLINDSLYRLLY